MPSVVPPGDPSIPLSTPIAPTAAPSNTARRASLKILSRNIDEVILGNLLFPTWYYSPYPDSIILGENQISTYAGTNVGGHGTSIATKHHHTQGLVNVNGIRDTTTGEQADSSSRTTPATARAPPTPCKRLHVCPYCFRYTPKPIAYVQHLRRHTVTYNPYPDSQLQQTRHRDSIEIDQYPSPASDTSEDASSWPVPRSAIKVYEHDGYTVWDVDGEREKLYCQNLSLFGKLFLEQKSVFFDTGGFHYFVLTYTPPAPLPSELLSKKASPSSTRTSARRRTSSGGTKPNNTSTTTAMDTFLADKPAALPPDINLHTRVLGFFSKENLSWDANNLACILVFPPYQHRNLGQLLMAVSYKLSGWEWEGSIIGGPEKPLSAMGRKSYLRFWSERVARFMMGQTADADGRKVFESGGGGEGMMKRRTKKGGGFNKEEMTVKEVGDRTGMLPEDVVAALNEMGVLEVVVPRKKKRKSEGDDTVVGGGGEEQEPNSMIVHRSKVLEWAEGRGVSLLSPVKEEGFLGEWALSEVDDDDDEVNEDRDEEEQESE